MTILILGATGFLGQAVTNSLIKANYNVHCCVKNPKLAKTLFPEATIHPMDFLEDTAVADWIPRLKNIDVIINCVGIFYHKDKKITWIIHYDTPKALYIAACQCGVKKIIHISALNIENYPTEYAKSKLAIEDFLKTQAIPTLILKPSLIYGTDAGGGMQLFQRLAALPVMSIPHSGNPLFQPIWVDDLASVILYAVTDRDRSIKILAAVSPKKITLKTIFFGLHRRLGYKKNFWVSMPLCLLRWGALLGNYVSYSMLNTDAILMLERGNVTTDPETKKFSDYSQKVPMSFNEAMKKLPLLPADSMKVKLFYLRPLLRLGLSFMWMMSAITSVIGYTKPQSYHLLAQMGVTWGQDILLYGAAGCDFLIGLGLLCRYKLRWNCRVQITLILIYTSIITFFLPHLWLEPFGSVFKNIPVLMSILMLYCLEAD